MVKFEKRRHKAVLVKLCAFQCWSGQRESGIKHAFGAVLGIDAPIMLPGRRVDLSNSRLFSKHEEYLCMIYQIWCYVMSAAHCMAAKHCDISC